MARSKDTTVQPPVPDYETEDVLVVSAPEQLRALGDELRSKIVARVRTRAASTSELAEELGLPKGTVGHHLKVLERAGLIRVVRTRRVRALTEKYYGRTARVFDIRSGDDPEAGAHIAAASLRRAADEIPPVWDADETATHAFLHVRLREADARRAVRKLKNLADELQERDTEAGEPFGFAVGFYRLGDDA